MGELEGVISKKSVNAFRRRVFGRFGQFRHRVTFRSRAQLEKALFSSEIVSNPGQVYAFFSEYVNKEGEPETFSKDLMYGEGRYDDGVHVWTFGRYLRFSQIRLFTGGPQYIVARYRADAREKQHVPEGW